MTVTKGKRTIAFPVISSELPDLDLSIDALDESITESIPEPVVRPFLPRITNTLKTEELNLPKNYGKRKLRRFENRSILQTLAVEYDEETTMDATMAPYCGPFTRLLQDEDALIMWNNFTKKSEEQQERVIADSAQRKQKTTENSAPAKRIRAKVKRIIRQKRNIALEPVRVLEDEIIEFFNRTPTKIYRRCIDTYFLRILIIAIAQYHGLHTLAMNEGGIKSVDVCKTTDAWQPEDFYFVDYLYQKRKSET